MSVVVGVVGVDYVDVDGVVGVVEVDVVVVVADVGVVDVGVVVVVVALLMARADDGCCY